MQHIKIGNERSKKDLSALRKTVSEIIEDVIANGDAALRSYSEKFDGFARPVFRVSREEINDAYSHVSEQELNDMKSALANIRTFAEAQRATIHDLPEFQPRPGISLGHRVIPVQSCCCYVPGGRFPLYSSAMMLITPAKVAGVKRIVTCSPVAHGTGTINDKTLVAMDLAGADEIYALGGVQAIAAFSYGTESILPVDVIVGPGNQYVAEAKCQCYGQVGIDFVAGPSEVLVIADENADPKTLAADLLAQCENDPNAKAILLSTNEASANAVIRAVEDGCRRHRSPASLGTPSVRSSCSTVWMRLLTWLTAMPRSTLRSIWQTMNVSLNDCITTAHSLSVETQRRSLATTPPGRTILCRP